MKSTRSAQTFAAMLVLLLSPCLAQAHLRLVRLRKAQGPFLITVFTSSELMEGRASEVSVLVQRCDSNEAVLDANVSFILKPPAGSNPQQTDPICRPPAPMTLVTMLGARDGQAMMAARRDQSPNKLLYAAPLTFPLAGPWKLEAFVRHGTESAQVTCEIPVGLPARRLAGLIPYLALPPLLVTFFAVNQWLRGRRIL